MLHCDHVTLSVPGRVLCRNVTLTVEPGQLWAVLGVNGSGKTTLLHALSGLAGCSGGTVRLNGLTMEAGDSRQRAGEIGVLLQQEDTNFWGSVLEYVLLGRFPQAKVVLAGHVHQAFDQQYGSFRVLATPSTCAQFTPGTATCVMDLRPPGYRWLSLLSDGSIRTEVMWLQDWLMTKRPRDDRI